MRPLSEGFFRLTVLCTCSKITEARAKVFFLEIPFQFEGEAAPELWLRTSKAVPSRLTPLYLSFFFSFFFLTNIMIRDRKVN